MRKYMIGFFSAMAGAVVGGWWTSKLVERNKQLSDKYLALFLLMDKWMGLNEQNKNLSSFFKDNNYKRIAVYGMGRVGERLIKELESSDIQVRYAIDKNIKNSDQKIKIITPEEQLPEVDVIVVTAITFFDEIKDNLKEKIDCPVISLEDVIDEL